MSKNLTKLPTFMEDGEDVFRVVIESPRCCGVKITYDPELGIFEYRRPLALGISYPYDWGFVTGTRGPDGDPVDAMVLSETPTYPGVVIPCRAVGVVEIEQTEQKKNARVRNDRIIAAPLRAPATEAFAEEGQVPRRLRKQLEQFFLSATLFEDNDVQILGWSDCAAALKLIKSSQA